MLYHVATIIITLTMDRTGICIPTLQRERQEALREEVAGSWSHGCEGAEPELIPGFTHIKHGALCTGACPASNGKEEQVEKQMPRK